MGVLVHGGGVTGEHEKLENNLLLKWLTDGDLLVESISGNEMLPERTYPELSDMLNKATEDGRYEGKLEPVRYLEDTWVPLLTNKHGECIAGAVNGENDYPWLLVLPQLPNFYQILPELLESHFVEWRPKIFPYHRHQKWIYQPEYEIPKILKLEKKIDEVRSEADKRVAELEQEITNEREANKDWYTLLQGTGSELVQAVIRSLERLGFQHVIDVDTQNDEQGQEGTRREDIQVVDYSPILVIDVKGVSGTPEDPDTTQAEKHAMMRMREWERTDVHPLTIINHQRNLPPHDRDPTAYRDEMIENAKTTGLGLMTTWDLFLILRNWENLAWPESQIRSVFFRPGRIEPIPDHYQEVGKIVHVWKHAFGIIPSHKITVGSQLAVQVDDSFEIVDVSSLQVDNEARDEAPAESNCGIGIDELQNKFREGMRVFRISDTP